MLSPASQRQTIQNHEPTAWPSRLMSITPRRDGCGWAYAYTIAVGTCLRHVLPRVRRAEARPTFWGVVDHSTTPTRDATKNRGRGIGGGAQREASIEGVRFRCRLQASLSASHTPHAPKPIPRAAAIEACVPIPQSSLVTFFQRK